MGIACFAQMLLSHLQGVLEPTVEEKYEKIKKKPTTQQHLNPWIPDQEASTLPVRYNRCPILCFWSWMSLIVRNSFRSTLPSYAAQSLTNSRLGNGLGHGHMTTFAGNPVTANLATLRRSSPNSSSQYSQWRIQKDLGGRCSWKFVAIFFVLLSVILISALIYTTGNTFHS